MFEERRERLWRVMEGYGEVMQGTGTGIGRVIGGTYGTTDFSYHTNPYHNEKPVSIEKECMSDA